MYEQEPDQKKQLRLHPKTAAPATLRLKNDNDLVQADTFIFILKFQP